MCARSPGSRSRLWPAERLGNQYATDVIGGKLRVLELSGAPDALGRVHGDSYADAIKAYLDDRLATLSDGAWFGHEIQSGLALEAAEASLDHHRQYSESLFHEMESLAIGAGISAAEAIAVGGFTDVVDIVRMRIGTAPILHECTGILNPARGSLAQTWDMNMSAGAFVIMLRIEPDSGPRTLVQTTTGCLGQIGLNEAGIGVGINNLASQGQPGVTWPFVVRRVLEQTNLDSAVAVVLEAHLAGGHNFLLIGPDGRCVNIEAMPNSRHITNSTSAPLVHSNHCLAENTAREEAAQPQNLVDDSRVRLQIATDQASDLDAFFGHPLIGRRGSNPHDGATCGAVVLNAPKKRMRAVWGVPGYQEWEDFGF